MEQAVHYTVTIHDEGDSYWAEIAEIPGCFATGDTLEELKDCLSEAVGFALSSPGCHVGAELAAFAPHQGSHASTAQLTLT